jgi:hypothetical protein
MYPCLAEPITGTPNSMMGIFYMQIARNTEAVENVKSKSKRKVEPASLNL